MANAVSMTIKIGDKDTEFAIEEVNRLKYCVFPRDTVLFRGDIVHTIEFHDRPLYLATSIEDAYQYGDVYQITLDKEYKLLNLNDKDTMGVIYDTASPDIKQILKKQYGYNSGKRNSDITRDNEFSKYLSKQNYDGYYLNKMPTDTGHAHPEIMICHPTRLTVGKMIKRLSDPDREAIIHRRKGEELEARRRERREENAKRRANIHDSDDEEEGGGGGGKSRGGLFGDDSDDEEGGGKSRRGLFGDDSDDEGGGGESNAAALSGGKKRTIIKSKSGKKSRKIKHRKQRKSAKMRRRKSGRR